MIIEQIILPWNDQKGREFLHFLWDNAIEFKVTFALGQAIFKVTALPSDIKRCLAKYDELLFG